MSKGDDPFDLSDGIIKEEDHVLVARLAPKEGKPCTYWKNFQPGRSQHDGKPRAGLAQAHYWTDRENKLIAELWAKNLKQVVQLAEIKRSPNGFSTPITAQIATFDAGLTLEDWLGQKPRYADGKTLSHPFQHAAAALALLRACLLALREIHERGFVHLDVKADNICLPYAPYPFKPGPGAPVSLDFDRLKLIDFAFSVSRDNPLRHRLPILPARAYQSRLLQDALREDAQRGEGGPFQADQLDWRADLYSLGHMIEGIIKLDSLLPPKGPGGLAAFNGIHSLVDRLQAFDHPEAPSLMPHGSLIADINSLLDGLEDREAHHRFEVERQQARPEFASAGSTPVANPDSKPARGPARRKAKLLAGGLTLAAAVLAAAAMAPLRVPGPPPPMPKLACPAASTPEAVGNFQQAADALWPAVSRHEAEAAGIWQNLRQTLTKTLQSPSGKAKASVLACLQAMENLGDTQAKDARQTFKARHLDFVSSEPLLKWLDKPPARRGPLPADFASGFENLSALAATGDDDARKDLGFFKEKGVKLP